MTNQQLYLAIGIPMLFNAGLIGILLAYINAKFSAVDQRFMGVDQRFVSIDQRFASLEQSLDRQFAAVDRRLDDLRDVWRAELHRVEEVLDARLKHLEER
jgi:hypothetical protein